MMGIYRVAGYGGFPGRWRVALCKFADGVVALVTLGFYAGNFAYKEAVYWSAKEFALDSCEQAEQDRQFRKFTPPEES